MTGIRAQESVGLFDSDANSQAPDREFINAGGSVTFPSYLSTIASLIRFVITSFSDDQSTASATSLLSKNDLGPHRSY